jgi:hypothetical protein
MRIAKYVRRFRRRRALQHIRRDMIALGRDPGDLLRSQNYRRLLRAIQRTSVAMQAFGTSAKTCAVAIENFGKAWLVLHDYNGHEVIYSGYRAQTLEGRDRQ